MSGLAAERLQGISLADITTSWHHPNPPQQGPEVSRWQVWIQIQNDRHNFHIDEWRGTKARSSPDDRQKGRKAQRGHCGLFLGQHELQNKTLKQDSSVKTWKKTPQCWLRIQWGSPHQPPALSHPSWSSNPEESDSLFFYFWLHWVFVAACRLSLVAASRGNPSLRCVGFLLRWLLLLQSTGSRHVGSVVVVHRLSYSAACGIFPDQGSNPCPLHWQADS